MRDDKRVRWDWGFLESLDNERLDFWLTDRQAAALIAVVRQMEWGTRWDNSPDEETFKRFAGEVAHRLSSPVKDPCEYPFWDEYTLPPYVDQDCDKDDPDDEEQQNEQSQFWQVADWIITGFLAVTSTPAAAITYQTLAPKVRILLERRTLGAVADFLINGVLVSSVDTSAGTAGASGELIENVIDISELVGSGAVPDSGGAGNIIQLVKASSAAAAVASPATLGEFQAQQQQTETELAVVTGNITFDDNTGDNAMTAQTVADGIELWHSRICGCIDGDSGGDSGGGGDGIIGSGVTPDSATPEGNYGEVSAVAYSLQDAAEEMQELYNSINTNSGDLNVISAERYTFQRYISLLYLVNGEPQDPAQGDPETGALYEFATDVFNRGGVLGGLAGGEELWALRLWCRDSTVRSELNRLAIGQLAGNNRENMLLMIAMFQDEQFVQWAGGATVNYGYSSAPCAPQYLAPITFGGTESGRKLTNRPDWVSRGEFADSVVLIEAVGRKENSAGNWWNGFWFYDAAADALTYLPISVGQDNDQFSSSFDTVWPFPQPNPESQKTTANVDHSEEWDTFITNDPVYVQVPFAPPGGSDWSGYTGEVTFNLTDLGMK